MAPCSSCCLATAVALLALLAAPVYYEVLPAKVADVAGKCAIVTGASDGIGVHIADKLAEEGVVKLIISARSEDKLRLVAENISARFPRTAVTVVRSDVSSEEGRLAVVKAAEAHFEPTCQIILVNNAAVYHLFHFEQAAPADIDAMLDVNVRGLVHLTHSMMPAVLRSGGHVVNIASAGGKMAHTAASVYCSSKFAVVGFTSGLRQEMIHRKLPVTVHAVLPGFVLEAGMAVKMATEEFPITMASDSFGYSFPADTAAAVVDAIRFDMPEVIVNSIPLQAGFALNALFSRFGDMVTKVPALSGSVSAWATGHAELYAKKRR